MGIILYTAILLYGINVMSSVLEEKTTRIVEVLVSSLRPFQLLLGKVLGVGAVSIFQFLIWGVAGPPLLPAPGRAAGGGAWPVGSTRATARLARRAAARFAGSFSACAFLFVPAFAGGCGV